MPNDADFIVRKLSPAGSVRDEEIKEIKMLCSDRSYLGKDIAEVFSYRDLWADFVIDPYIELSSDFLWIAQGEETGEILGYLTGAVRVDDKVGPEIPVAKDLGDVLTQIGTIAA